MHDNEPSVSVIVPVFNTEAYLQECIDSVLAQQLTTIEILCVDDGSTDGSVNILNEYARRDSRIKLIPQRPGGKGPGSARNTALQAARGKYVAFVDSDDLLHESMLRRMQQAANQNDADVVMCTIAKFSDSDQPERYPACSYRKSISSTLDQQTFSWKDIQEVLFDLRFAAWNKIYKRSFLGKWDIRFSEGIFYEDLNFSYRAILRAERMRYLRKPALYFNRKEREGATTFELGPRVFDAISAMEQFEQFLTENPEYDQLRERFEAFRFTKLYKYLHKNDSAHLPQFFEKLKCYASSSSLDGNPYLRGVAAEKRLLVKDRDLLEFLALELWEAKNKNASLSRQKRQLEHGYRAPTRLARPIAARLKSRTKSALKRIRLVG